MKCEYDAFESKSFFRLPQCGMVAWLQYRHKINLNYTCFIASNNALAKYIGIRYFPASEMMKTSTWNAASKL